VLSRMRTNNDNHYDIRLSVSSSRDYIMYHNNCSTSPYYTNVPSIIQKFLKKKSLSPFSLLLILLIPYLSFFLVQFVPPLHFLLSFSSSLLPLFSTMLILLPHSLHLLPTTFPPPFSLTISPVPSLYASFSFPFDLYSCAIISFSSSLCSYSLLYFFVSVFPFFNLLLSPFTPSS
jgi:hypothetical protein